ncbi:MAG: winged helix-turn-helix domain-containing protein [Acidobacteriia bacterium]|nr:winged helix-turn-helix domain-containing protein [Terriglobia bacterium]
MKTSDSHSLVTRFGVFELDLQSRELHKQGMKIRLHGQPIEILAVLLERAGETVTREELRKRLWPADTFVDFEQGLNNAIKRLRAALEDDSENPRFIETLPRLGYRFIGSVNDAGQGISVEAPAPVSRPARWLRLPWSVVAAFALVFALVLLAVLKGQPRSPKILGTTQLTSDGREKGTAIATDGLRIYFSELVDGHWTVAAVSTSGGQVVPIPTPLKDAVLLNISPDRSELLVGGAGNLEEMPLWLVPILGGAPRRLGSMLAHDGSWSPDGEKFVYANGGALYLTKSDGTGFRELVRGDPDSSVYARSPTWSPDGSRIRFAFYQLGKEISALWEITAEGKNQQQVFPGWQSPPMQCCGAWTRDGRYYLFNSWRGLLGTGISPTADIWAVREKTGLFGKRSLVPKQLTVGPMHFWNPIASLDGKALFAISSRSRGELMRYDAGTRHFLPYLSGISAEGMSFSKDGAWMAYVKFPQGELWRSKTDGSEPLQLTFPPLIVYDPHWSPDGKRIAFSGLKAGGQWQLYVVSADGGALQRLLPESEAGIDPTWSPDGNSLLFGQPTCSCTPISTLSRFSASSVGRGPSILKILDLQTQRVSVVPESEGLRSPRWSPDGRYISAHESGGARLMLFDVATRKWTLLARDMGPGWESWAQNSIYVYFLATTSADGPGIFRVAVGSKKLEKVASLKDFRWAGTFGAWFSLTPEDEPLVLRDVGPPEIYAFSWDAP